MPESACLSVMNTSDFTDLQHALLQGLTKVEVGLDMLEVDQLGVAKLWNRKGRVDLSTPQRRTLRIRITPEDGLVPFPGLDPFTLSSVEGIRLEWSITYRGTTTLGSFDPSPKISMGWLALHQLGKAAYERIHHMPQSSPLALQTHDPTGTARIDRAIGNALAGRMIVRCVFTGDKLNLPVPRPPEDLAGNGGAIHHALKLPTYACILRHSNTTGLYAHVMVDVSKSNCVTMAINRPGEDPQFFVPYQDEHYPQYLQSFVNMCAAFRGVPRAPRPEIGKPKPMQDRAKVIEEAQTLAHDGLKRTLTRADRQPFIIWKIHVQIPAAAMFIMAKKGVLNASGGVEVRWGIHDGRLTIWDSATNLTLTLTYS